MKKIILFMIMGMVIFTSCQNNKNIPDELNKVDVKNVVSSMKNEQLETVNNEEQQVNDRDLDGKSTLNSDDRETVVIQNNEEIEEIEEIEKIEKNDSSETTNNNDEQTTQKESTISLDVIGPKEVGTILAEEVLFVEGESAFELLLRVTASEDVLVDYSGSNQSVYVKGISNIYEKDYGALSGWMYTVNGEFLLKSSGSYELLEGDTIQFLYTKDMGKDIGND